MALAAGVRPEADILHHLIGLTAFATTPPAGPIDGVLLALHTDGEPAAARIADQVLPRIALAARLVDRIPDPEADGALPLGRPSGRPLRVTRRGSTILIAWGRRPWPAALDARDHPEHSAGPALRHRGLKTAPNRAGASGPAASPASMPARSWEPASAVRLPSSGAGRRGPEPRATRSAGPAYAASSAALLDRLPMDPPPDRSGLIDGKPQMTTNCPA